MKNAQKFVCKSITLFLLVFVYSCGVDDKKPECPECNCPVADESYDNGIIFPEEAQKLYVNYENRRVKLIQDFEDAYDEKNTDYKKQQQNQQGQNPGEGDNKDPNGAKFDVARYVFYNYEDLKKYMAYIENEAKLSGEKLSTLRFYFANYPDEETFPDGDVVVHRRQNSIMMSPTVKRPDGEHIFLTRDVADGKREIVLLENDFKRRKGDGSGEEQAEPKNEASLIPSFLPNSSKAPMFVDHSTTKNEGSSAPPPH